MPNTLEKAKEIVRTGENARRDYYAPSNTADDLLLLVTGSHPNIANRPKDSEPELQRVYDEVQAELRNGR